MKAVPVTPPAPARPASMHGHSHTLPGQHEHESEPQYGLPEPLPAGETLLWQGAPDWKLLAVRRFHVRKLMVYFGVLLAARLAGDVGDGQSWLLALAGALPLLSLAVLAIVAVGFIAWMSARNTVYTLTDQRVVMRIGIVLTLALNLPLRRMSGAALDLHGGTRGDIALQLQGQDRIAYLHLWPHARRWRFARPEPTLLCVPDAQAVADRLTAAWRVANVQAGVPVQAEAHAAAPQRAPTLAMR